MTEALNARELVERAFRKTDLTPPSAIEIWDALHREQRRWGCRRCRKVIELENPPPCAEARLDAGIRRVLGTGRDS
jgi:hypothetical protein